MLFAHICYIFSLSKVCKKLKKGTLFPKSRKGFILWQNLTVHNEFNIDIFVGTQTLMEDFRSDRFKLLANTIKNYCGSYL